MAEQQPPERPSKGGPLPVVAWEYEVESGGEASIEVLDRNAICERIYCGGLTGRERVRPLVASTADPTEPWALLTAHAEFQDVLDLVGINDGDAAERRIRGWRKDASATSPPLPPRRSVPPGLTPVPPRAPVSSRPALRPPSSASPSKGPAPGPKEDGSVLTFVLVVALGLAAIVALLMR